MRRNSYQTVFQIWEQALLTYENRAGNNLSYAPTLRTSDQIYEYYVYFSLIEVFEQLGYCIDDQMTQFSYLGLSDGTSVYLRDENGAVMLTFNEEIELNHFNAMRNGGGFYTFEMKRKPDIRIDLYSLDGEYSKVSSIFEVKYRPLNSIYSARDIREAETQMSKYWAIGYVDSAGQFTPRVVRSVNCVYPGDERAEPVIHGPQGDFVQFYPISQSEEYGRENLTGIIQNWLNQHQK
jgi:predicted component of viral defense system (DUF524 family)